MQTLMKLGVVLLNTETCSQLIRRTLLKPMAGMRDANAQMFINTLPPGKEHIGSEPPYQALKSSLSSPTHQARQGRQARPVFFLRTKAKNRRSAAGRSWNICGPVTPPGSSPILKHATQFAAGGPAGAHVEVPHAAVQQAHPATQGQPLAAGEGDDQPHRRARRSASASATRRCPWPPCRRRPPAAARARLAWARPAASITTASAGANRRLSRSFGSPGSRSSRTSGSAWAPPPAAAGSGPPRSAQYSAAITKSQPGGCDVVSVECSPPRPRCWR